MTQTLSLVIYMAILTWAAMMVASLIRTQGWSMAGMKLALGNRDNLPPPTPLGGRAERAARNTAENLVFFAVIALVAHAAGVTNPKLALGAQIFFWARVLYLPVYFAGIAYLRTTIWAISVVGLGMMIGTLGFW
jgi:uncharacterized MAPEG superfamily protein